MTLSGGSSEAITEVVPRRLAVSMRWGARVVALEFGALVLFVAVTIIVRGNAIATWKPLNPDEAELMAQALAAKRSFLPFTTWTMGTTGPIWPMFLAVLGHLGLPLTLSSAHLIAAGATGLMTYFVFVLMRRSFGVAFGFGAAALWWLLLAVIFPLHDSTNYAAMSTELLPASLVLAAGLIPTTWLTDRPWLFAASGLLGGLAVGSKYQVLPLALALVVAQLLTTGLSRKRSWCAFAWWCAGAAAPFVAIVVALVMVPSVSHDLIRQNMSFLGAYAGNVGLTERVHALYSLTTQSPFPALILIFITRLACISSRRVVIVRVGLTLAGLATVAAGGMRFSHYLWFLYIAFALAAALPIRGGTRVVPRVSPVIVGAIASVMAMVGLLVVSYQPPRPHLTDRTTLLASLQDEAVIVDPSVLEVCPTDSQVLVWGWAAELYVYYSWNNTVPFMNTLGLRSTRGNLEAGRPIVGSGIANADCIVDASGPPFFSGHPEASLELVYPEFAQVLRDDFTKQQGVLGCAECALYVRN